MYAPQIRGQWFAAVAREGDGLGMDAANGVPPDQAPAKLALPQECNYKTVVIGTYGDSVRWTWRNEKNWTNKRDHGLSFETARLVFNDPLAASRPDPHPDGDRWQTVGLAGNVVLFVVHTGPDTNTETGEETGQIISARRATAHERRTYEEGDF